jgi:hypothetical protein
MPPTSEWDKTLGLLRGLWPKWDVTPEQLVTWRDEFGNLNQPWLREALRNTYAQYSSDHPKPSWISRAFREVHAGKTQTPITEADVAERHRKEQAAKGVAERHDAEASQLRMRKEIAAWTAEERALWVAESQQRYRLLLRSTRGEFDVDDVDTWSNMVVGVAYSLKSQDQDAAA